MGRKKAVQKRIGKLERADLNNMITHIRTFKVYKSDKRHGETKLNDYLIRHLKQNTIAVLNKDIPTAKFLSEVFRPECYLQGSGAFPLACVECKKATDATLKANWKEGLSQCLLYSEEYKYVIYVIYDFTKTGRVAKAFGRGRKTETTFARRLREKLRINTVVLKAQ